MIDKALFMLPGFRLAAGLMAAVSAATALLTIGQAWCLASALAALWQGASLADQVWSVVGFAGCFVLRQAVANLQSRWLDAYAAERADELRASALKRLFDGGRQVVQAEGTGNLTTLMIEGVDQVESYVRLILPKLSAIVVIPLIMLAVVFPHDWVTGLIALVVFPAVVLQMVLIGSTARYEARVQHREYRRLANHFVDSVRGIDTLKLFGRSKQHGESIYETSERFREATMRTLRVATLSGAVLDAFSTLSLAAVAVMLGFRLVDGSVGLHAALFVLVLMPEYFRPIREFASDYHASLDGKNAFSSLRRLIDGDGRAEAAEFPGAPLQEPDGDAGQDGACAPDVRPGGVVTPWCETSTLELRDVSFSYGEGDALNQVSLRAHGFQKIGIVGFSGGGKTSLVNVLSGFASPSSGVVEVNGVSIGSLACEDWRRQAVYIPQNPYLFHATLRENIAFYRPDATAAELEEAVRVVGLERLVREMPEGLDTMVGAGARALSGGQAQRIALARAFLDQSRRILLFDEPTAHLDIETEIELKERMLPLMEDRLVFFATHRLHWADDMDVLVVLENGRVAEVGSADELVARAGAFARLVDGVNGGAR